MAIPPLPPWLGTITPFNKPTFAIILLILLIPAFVSIKNTSLGHHRCTRLRNAQTDRGFRNPQQFQLKVFMALDDAALQTLLIDQGGLSYYHKIFFAFLHLPLPHLPIESALHPLHC